MIKRFQLWARVFNMLIICIGIAVLLGWTFNINFLTRPFPGFVAMNPATAIAFALSGISLILLSPGNSFTYRVTGNALATVVLLTGVIKILSIVFVFDAQIDHILFEGKLNSEVADNLQSRMVPNTAFCFILTGTALLLLHYQTPKKIMPSHFISVIIASVGLLSLLGYAYYIDALTHLIKYIPMAVHTALGFLFISMAILFAHPDKGILRAFTSPFEGSSMARRFLPVAILIPIILGFLRIYSTTAGLLHPELGTTLLVMGIIIIFVFYIYYTAVSINRKDSQRKKAEDLLHSIIDNASSFIYIKDLDGKYKLVNNSYPKLFGIGKEDIIGKTAFDILNYDSALQLQQQDEELIQENKVFESEQRIPIGGAPHDFFSVRFPVTNAAGEVYATGGIFTDITEIKKQSNLIKDLYDNAPCGYYSVDVNGKFINANNTTLAWLGYNKEELMGKFMEDITAPGYIEGLKTSFASFKKEGILIDKESTYIRKDGSVFPVMINASAVKNEFGDFLYSRSTIFDITEQKKTEAAIKESNEKFLHLFYSSPLAMIIRNIEDGKILDVNTEYERLLGYKKEELIGKTSMGVGMILDPEFSDQIRNKASKGSLKNIEATLYNSKKEAVSVIVSIEHLRLENKDCILSALLDITDRKKLEENLNLVNKELESFTYSISHDLRAPLRIINGYAQMIKEDSSITTDEPKRMLDNIMTNAKQMGHLIDDLLNFSRLGRKELITHPANMNEIVQPVMEQKLNGTKKYTIQIADLPSCLCDSSLIKQVWGNLISNAIKYSANNPIPAIEIGSSEEDGKTLYYIKDNGAGFDMKYYDKLFGVFQRLHKASEFEGTGVGLALCQRIIAKHGGKIWANSEVNKGTTFYFTVSK